MVTEEYVRRAVWVTNLPTSVIHAKLSRISMPCPLALANATPILAHCELHVIR